MPCIAHRTGLSGHPVGEGVAVLVEIVAFFCSDNGSFDEDQEAFVLLAKQDY